MRNERNSAGPSWELIHLSRWSRCFGFGYGGNELLNNIMSKNNLESGEYYLLYSLSWSEHQLVGGGSLHHIAAPL
jgi:hypothetical protein